ncbi:LOW QUALITY PROTEIN: polypyrimidine tract-binding protein homolog 1-like [Coffea eugenioides]|uniref:LOW QUALITY PROTEIN: polypyrimidine tract-binding protein homolog 1-like n=1 Tax=Coffea eugenioides TaxID=49369 RepID=UPI000F609F8C|nr:LOW QUALITY PROTEIN: polypyrimidine tract-binding protein homolog 1-like [Coffea eugenioides]
MGPMVSINALKVLHLRNLPWECSEEELIELCNPFGKVVNTKCNAGSYRNQAFIEFVDLSQAINMVNYYASSSEPAHVRGKTVYIQYSNRHEIVNNKSPGDVPGNDLLVIMIEGVEAGDVSIHVIHLMVQQAVAKEPLEGHCIYDGGYCKLHLTYSRHTDLNAKPYSERSRDYTIPDSGLLGLQQASLTGAATVWQNSQAASLLAGNGFGRGGAAQAQSCIEQVSSWDPIMYFSLCIN